MHKAQVSIDVLVYTIILFSVVFLAFKTQFDMISNTNEETRNFNADQICLNLANSITKQNVSLSATNLSWVEKEGYEYEILVNGVPILGKIPSNSEVESHITMPYVKDGVVARLDVTVWK